MNTQKPNDLRSRTKAFALRIIRMYRSLPKSGEARVIGNQVLRSGTSVGAQYREACRAKSPADFVNMMEGALKELDESAYWLELLVESEIVPAERLAELQKETDELIAIFVASINTAKKNNPKK
ncbi:MAG: four helix bundle protein [Anaerolineales bacterium]